MNSSTDASETTDRETTASRLYHWSRHLAALAEELRAGKGDPALSAQLVDDLDALYLKVNAAAIKDRERRQQLRTNNAIYGLLNETVQHFRFKVTEYQGTKTRINAVERNAAGKFRVPTDDEERAKAQQRLLKSGSPAELVDLYLARNAAEKATALEKLIASEHFPKMVMYEGSRSRWMADGCPVEGPGHYAKCTDEERAKDRQDFIERLERTSTWVPIPEQYELNVDGKPTKLSPRIPKGKQFSVVYFEPLPVDRAKREAARDAYSFFDEKLKERANRVDGYAGIPTEALEAASAILPSILGYKLVPHPGSARLKIESVEPKRPHLSPRQATTAVVQQLYPGMSQRKAARGLREKVAESKA